MGKHYDYDWETLIEQQERSGMNMKAFCKEHQLPYQAFKSHKNTLQKQTNGFIEAKAESDIITLFVNGNEIKIDSSVNDITLNRIIKALVSIWSALKISLRFISHKAILILEKALTDMLISFRTISLWILLTMLCLYSVTGHRDKLKCLYWDGTGFWLLYKRLDKGHFKWKKDDDGALLITQQQLQWLLQGLKIEQKTAFEATCPKYL